MVISPCDFVAPHAALVFEIPPATGLQTRLEQPPVPPVAIRFKTAGSYGQLVRFALFQPMPQARRQYSFTGPREAMARAPQDGGEKVCGRAGFEMKSAFSAPAIH